VSDKPVADADATVPDAATLAELRALAATPGLSAAAAALLNDLDARCTRAAADRRDLAHLRFALDQHAIVSVTDASGVIIEANPRFCATSGYSREELIGQPHRIVKSGLHPPETFREMWETISSGRVWHGEICNRRKDGSHYWVAATIVPSLDADGLPVRYVGIRTEITARKEMEMRLAEQLQLIEALVEAIPLPLYFKDAEGRYLRLNRAFEHFFAARRADFLGRTLHELLRPEDARLHLDKDAELLAKGGTQVYEAHVVTRDGVAHETIYRKAALTRADGTISGLLGVVIDITERKEAERTLRRAMEVAEAANRAKNDFLANVSHEIRTPMNAIVGMTDLVLAGELADEQREYLGIVRSSSASLLAIINDILDFSRIEAGRLLIEHVAFDLPQLLADSVHALSVRAAGKGLALAADLAPTLPQRVIGDPGRLRQVLGNLIDNAIKFTEHGSVRVAAAPTPAAGVRIEVVDTGIGIAPQKQSEIFEAFVQADTSVTRRFGGTGLGLAICHRLVAMMGGRLWVESAPGEGSRFIVDIPLHAAGTRAAGAGATPAAATAARADARAAATFDYAAAVAAAGAEVIELVVPLFLEAYADDLARLRDALDAGDSDAALRQTQTLRGIVGHFRAEPPLAALRAIETALRKGDLDAARAAFAGFDEKLGELVAVLQNLTQLR